jgi:exodeoxyribonuclease V alpha subunit
MKAVQGFLIPTGTAQARVRPASAYPPELLDLMRGSDLDETRAYLAWQTGEMAQGLGPTQRAAFVVLCGRLLVAEAQGSTRLALDDKDRALLARVPELVGQAQGNTPLVVDHDHLYTRRSHACEARVVAALAGRLVKLGPFSPLAVAQVLQAVEEGATPAPSAEQKAAVAQALARPVGIISGGPGTGKTTTALTLVRCLVRLGVAADRIALCAPTGKAASRMEDDIRRRLAALDNPDPADRALLRECPKAQTVHRLLGARGDLHSVLPTTHEPLPFRAVIVDESSMVDLVLMDRLLAALPDDAALILLGDSDQLPSVSAGSVFRDLGAYATRLQRGFRTDTSQAAGQQLATFALAVRAGESARAAELCSPRRDPRELCYEGIEQVARESRAELLRQYRQRHFGSHEAAALARHVYSLREGTFEPDEAARLDALAARLGRSRILTVTRERATGSNQTNAFLHELHGGGGGFLPGEPVLMLRNDYQRELWNGDQGMAILLRRPGRQTTVAVAFRCRTGWLAVDPEPMGSALNHGYALTVHKAQGSEFDEVLLLLPDSACPIFTRELLYTAISRARRSVVLCGPPDMVNLAIATVEIRDSGVATRLASRVRSLPAQPAA